MQSSLAPVDAFAQRHLGEDPVATGEMLGLLGYASTDALIEAAVPAQIRRGPLNLPGALGESAALAELRAIAGQNRVFRSFIGAGYYDTHTPAVIQRDVFENPGWYTAYTPYQAEISQGRLEALLNFQTMVADLTGLEIANASHARRGDRRRRGDDDVPPAQGGRRPRGSSSSHRPATRRRSTSS